MIHLSRNVLSRLLSLRSCDRRAGWEGVPQTPPVAVTLLSPNVLSCEWKLSVYTYMIMLC